MGSSLETGEFPDGHGRGMFAPIVVRVCDDGTRKMWWKKVGASNP